MISAYFFPKSYSQACYTYSKAKKYFVSIFMFVNFGIWIPEAKYLSLIFQVFIPLIAHFPHPAYLLLWDFLFTCRVGNCMHSKLERTLKQDKTPKHSTGDNLAAVIADIYFPSCLQGYCQQHLQEICEIQILIYIEFPFPLIVTLHLWRQINSSSEVALVHHKPMLVLTDTHFLFTNNKDWTRK